MVEQSLSQSKSVDSLLAVYKLTDFPVDQWLTDLLQLKSNGEFKQKLSEVPIINELKQFCDKTYTKAKSSEPDNNNDSSPPSSPKEPLDMNALKSLCESHLKPLTNKQEVTTFIWFLMSVYLRENSLGPSVYSEYVEETRAPLVRSGKLPENELDSISYKNLPLQKAMLK